MGCPTELLLDTDETNIEVVSEQSEVILTPSSLELSVDNLTSEITSSTSNTSITLPVQQVTIEATSQQGPTGPTGIPEVEMIYAKRVDFIGDDLIYKGEAQVGSSNSSSLWRIRRLTFDPAQEDDLTEEWADGSPLFNKVWDDRLTYGYS
jgi:hypothetical protein